MTYAVGLQTRVGFEGRMEGRMFQGKGGYEQMLVPGKAPGVLREQAAASWTRKLQVMFEHNFL